ncbi:hypothetical protein [Chryseobacterium arachidis]|nr:hypothetical protein [Chryseobacterium arachidis]
MIKNTDSIINVNFSYLKRTLFFALFLLFSNYTFSQNFPKQVKLIEDFVPKGWKVIYHTQGDLNKDQLDDQVVIIEDTNPKNFRKNENFGSDQLNLNPRIILVFFKNKNQGYTLVAKNNKGFIPTENSEMNPCLEDPLLETGGISIEKGLLKISFRYWLSCGSWFVNNADYTFRFQNNRFELIGFEHSEFHRATGEESSTSINFSTRKKSETTGGSMSDDHPGNEKTVWSTIKPKKIYDLQNMVDEDYFEILGIERN